MPQITHSLGRGHRNIVIVSISAGHPCDEITHRLRMRHGTVVIIISIAAGSPCNEITHILRRGYGKVIMIIISAGSTCDEIGRAHV